MKKYYMAAMHNVVKALEASSIQFPITKADLIAKAGDREIFTDWDSSTSLKELLNDVTLEGFDNKSQFFNSLTAALTEL
jgi:hypothetical protein